MFGRPRNAELYICGFDPIAFATICRNAYAEDFGWPSIPFTARNKHELSSGTTRITNCPSFAIESVEGPERILELESRLGFVIGRCGFGAGFVVGAFVVGLLFAEVSRNVILSPDLKYSFANSSSEAITCFGGNPVSTVGWWCPVDC